MLRGIRARLLGLVVATVVPFAALIGGGLWTQWRNDEAQALKDALTDARLLAAQADDQIGDLENLLLGLSRAVSIDPKNTHANDTILRQVKTEASNLVGDILLSTLDGNNIGNSYDKPDEGRSFVGNREYFHAVAGGQRLAIGEPTYGRRSGKWYVAVAHGVQDSSGRLAGMIELGIQLAHFQDALTRRDLPAGTVVQIVSQNGSVIARNVDGPAWIGRNLNQNKFIARHLTEIESSEAAIWPDDVTRITGSAHAVSMRWLVSVGLPTNVALANVVTRLTWGAAASLLALLMSIALALGFSRRIISLLRQLSEDASALAAGKLSHRTAISTQDEVGALANTFNTMAASLEARHRELDLAREAASAEAIERTRLQQMECQAKETLAAVIDASPVAIICSDLDRRIVVWSRAAEQIFGYQAEEALGQRSKLLPREGIGESQALFERCLQGEAVRGVEVKRKRKDGVLIDVRLVATPMFDPDGKAWGVAWAYDDITDRKKAEHQLNNLAHFDQLTGLPNRVALKSELATLLAGNEGQRPHSIALFDLDGFKDVNDNDGHSTGDQLLVEVARRLSLIATGRGRVYRLGGDEFVVVIPGCGDPRSATELVESMLKQLVEPFVLNDHVVHIGGSAGIAIAPQDGSTVDELIANADLALYKAKADGGHTYRIFVPVLRARAQMRRGLQADLRLAFARNEFELYFQPQIRLADEAVVGAEALLRWRHPQRGLIAPGAFIDSLAESSIAPAVGRWILQDACEKVSQWRANGLLLNRIGVNLFPVQCRDPKLPADVEHALQNSGLPPDMLELEISETFALDHDGDVTPLQEVHNRGVTLAFDDFGTGYASLSYLTQFPVSRIKIDRSFIAKVDDGAEAAAIVRALIAMAHNLKLGIIAEGVETAAQARFLLDENCEEAQGFLYAKPLAAADFEAYLRERRLASRAPDALANQSSHSDRPQRSPARTNRRRSRA